MVCHRCGKENVTDMDGRLWCTWCNDWMASTATPVTPKCEKCGRSASYLLPVEVRLAGTDVRSKVVQVCDKCFTGLASGAVQVGFE
mgnify:CR=1 FL=1